MLDAAAARRASREQRQPRVPQDPRQHRQRGAALRAAFPGDGDRGRDRAPGGRARPHRRRAARRPRRRADRQRADQAVRLPHPARGLDRPGLVPRPDRPGRPVRRRRVDRQPLRAAGQGVAAARGRRGVPHQVGLSPPARDLRHARRQGGGAGAARQVVAGGARHVRPLDLEELADLRQVGHQAAHQRGAAPEVHRRGRCPRSRSSASRSPTTWRIAASSRSARWRSTIPWRPASASSSSTGRRPTPTTRRWSASCATPPSAPPATRRCAWSW